MVSTRSASRTGAPNATPSPTKPTVARRTRSSMHRSSASTWSHTATTPTLAWLAFSLPLVAWDSAYVLLRPLSMPGGSLHWPLFVPYELYGTVDHMYGSKAWDAGVGFTAAQTLLNVFETAMYAAYLWFWYADGEGEGLKRAVGGRKGGAMLLVGFAAAVMTLSKTVLYWAQEYYSAFDGIGHNSLVNLIFLWIIPNGLWLIGSGYMSYSMGSEIVNGLASAPANIKED